MSSRNVKGRYWTFVNIAAWHWRFGNDVVEECHGCSYIHFVMEVEITTSGEIKSRRGGRRPGAGRPRGSGWKSKRPPAIRKLARKAIEKALSGNVDPVSVLLAVAADETQPVETRVRAAIGAAPYCYPRLSSMLVADVTPQQGATDHHRLLLTVTRKLAALTAPSPVLNAEPVADPVPVEAAE